MKTIKIFKVLIGASILASTLSACSGGTTAGGLGLSVGGTWSGALFQGNARVANFTMGLSQASSDSDDPFSSNNLVGSLSTSDECISSGTIEGTLGANNINITVKTPNGKLTLTGITNNSSMNGSWVNAGELTITTGEDTIIKTDDFTTTTKCNFGGTWGASR